MICHKSPLFSIITAVFNDHAGLRRTASSLEGQTQRDFQWIIVDGGSTDGTVDFLRHHAGDAQWISEPDDGIADAWNKGIRLSGGRYIVILNAGDTIDSNYLEVMTSMSQEERITCCPVRLVDAAGIPAGLMEARPDKLWRGMHLPHNWCVVPRRIYLEMGDYPHRRFGMDFAWFHRYYLRHGRDGFWVVPQVLGTYHLGGHSDRGYRRSFAEVELILRENGTSYLVARFLRISYTLKHWTKFRLLRKIRSRPGKQGL